MQSASPNNMGTEHSPRDVNSPEYLAQLLKDKKQIQAFPNVFMHLERILDEEINKVRGNLFHLSTNKEPLALPDAQGPVVSLSEKLYVPTKDHPEFNFVGRILGPRGMTAKQLEQDTGCKIMVRGKGSMRDKKKVSMEDLNRGKPNWEHLNEELHVLITVEDSKNRAESKLRRAVEEVKRLLVPAPEGEDDLKKRQLMELAIINGTYRDTKSQGNSASPHSSISPPTGIHTLDLQNQWAAGAGFSPGHLEMPRMMNPAMQMANFPPGLRSPTNPAGGHPIILAPRQMQMATSQAQQMMNGGPPPLVSPAEASLFYPYDPYGLAAASATQLLEYPGLEQAGGVPKLRGAVPTRDARVHPYARGLLS